MTVYPKYITRATATGGGRDGKTSLDDGTLAFQLVFAKEHGGPGGPGANPEDLFALGTPHVFWEHFASGSTAQDECSRRDNGLRDNWHGSTI
jgi:hypothetical protein